MSNTTPTADASSGNTRQFVTLTVKGQLFGIPVLSVQDVLAKQTIANVPLAHPVVAGLINLRGRIVTAIDLRRRMGLEDRPDGADSMNVVVEHGKELYSLIIDTIGDVLTVPADKFERNLATLDPLWRSFSDGIYRLDQGLLVVLDIGRLLDFSDAEAA
ncbi:MAG: chemotaxis protein CheW [Alphaproteobacteria bacterium]|nr:chemotaxis protein CheW [Alphaproteobacteria bacterium]